MKRKAPTTVALIAGLVALIGSVAGCGSSNVNCTGGNKVSIATQLAPPPSHLDPAPANQVRFRALIASDAPDGAEATSSQCPNAKVEWTVSDSEHVRISSADDESNGVATCLGATHEAITVTASVRLGETTKTASSSLTCK